MYIIIKGVFDLEKDDSFYKRKIYCNRCGNLLQCVFVEFDNCESLWYCMECLRAYAKYVKKQIDSFEKDSKEHSELMILIENFERLKEVI